MTEESKQHWIRIAIIALIFFILAYLAFYLAMKHNLKNASNPFYQAERLEKIMEKQLIDFNRDNNKRMENPFEPTMRPMMINLIKELNEYKVIVDLSQLDNDEKAVNVDIQGDELTINGHFDKQIRGTEKIINFTQTYYLNEKLDKDNIIKERKGNKYIITIPFKSNDSN